jgi:hemerythrin-like domain-containing protein
MTNNKETIIGLMVDSHNRLEGFLEKFKLGVEDDLQSADNDFEKFKEELKSHLSIEEEAIFKLIKPVEEEGYYEVIPDLIEEHNLLLEMLNDLGNKLATDREIDVSKFEKVLIQHKKTEEEYFYPQLENKIEEGQKQEIINKIKKLSN